MSRLISKAQLRIPFLLGCIGLSGLLSACAPKQAGQALPKPTQASPQVGQVDSDAVKTTAPSPVADKDDESEPVESDASIVFQLGGIGPRPSYDAAAKQVSNIDISSASPVVPREVVDNATECQSPGDVAAKSVIAVCVGGTKIEWASGGDENFVITMDEEVPMAVISKPKFMEAFVGTRDESDQFSGSLTAQEGNTLVLLGHQSMQVVKNSPASASIVSSLPPVDPAMEKLVQNVGASETGSDVDASIVPAVVPDAGAIRLAATANPTYFISTPGTPGVAVERLLQAGSLGIYLSDFSLIRELEVDKTSEGISSRRALYLALPAGSNVIATFFKKLEFLKTGQSFTLLSKDVGKPLKCEDLTDASVFGIKLYHLFLEISAKATCKAVNKVNKGIKFAFPPLELEMSLGASGQAISNKSAVSGGKGITFLNEVPVVSDNQEFTMGISGWRTLSNHSKRADYDKLDTSLELLIAPALGSMLSTSQKIYVAHFFITLPKHDVSTNDMKGKEFHLKSTNVAFGTYPLEGDVVPFHTLVIRPHLFHFDLRHKVVSYAWPEDTKLSGEFVVPTVLSAQSQEAFEVDLNEMSEHPGSCGYNLRFAPVGDETFEAAEAIKMPLNDSIHWPVCSNFFIDTLFDVLGIEYANNAGANCIAESDVQLFVSPIADPFFDVIEGPQITFDVKASLKDPTGDLAADCDVVATHEDVIPADADLAH